MIFKKYVPLFYLSQHNINSLDTSFLCTPGVIFNLPISVWFRITGCKVYNHVLLVPSWYSTVHEQEFSVTTVYNALIYIFIVLYAQYGFMKCQPKNPHFPN